MSEIYACIFCVHANPKREKDGKIRCERFSEWHDPIQSIKCENFFDKSFDKRKAELMKQIVHED